MGLAAETTISVVRVSASDDPWRLRAALAGEEAAWVGIVEEFAPTVWQWARRRGLTHDEAADVSQTVWYRLKDRGHLIDEPDRLPGWLATTTAREAQRVRQRRQRWATVPIGDDAEEHAPIDVVEPGPSPDQTVAAADLRARLRAAFETLRPRCRELLSLCWPGNLSYVEIAEALDMPVGSIGPTRQRCLGELRAVAGV